MFPILYYFRYQVPPQFWIMSSRGEGHWRKNWAVSAIYLCWLMIGHYTTILGLIIHELGIPEFLTHKWRFPMSWRYTFTVGWFIENPIYHGWYLGVSPSPGLPGAGLLGPVHGLPEAASGGSAAGNRQRCRGRVRELSHLQDPTGLPLVEATGNVLQIFGEM